MFSASTVTLTLVVYMLVLIVIAQWVEKRFSQRGLVLKSPWLYVLALAVYHTSWTFYGSVGFASRSGLLFLGIYVGAIIGVLLWWFTLRKMVAAKEHFRITSIADFIATRYRRSQKIAALVTLMAALGSMPYIALQLKAVHGSFDILTRYPQADSSPYTGLLVTGLMIAFTIAFGIRRLDPTERHQGMMMVLAVESLVKLLAFIAVGVFVCFFLFSGPGELLESIQAAELGHLLQADSVDNSFSQWMTLIVLSFAGIILLPRQFHVAVVENTDQRHIRTAIWLFPLYMLAINLFVLPIAAAGLLTGLPLAEADFFVLLLPQLADQQSLTLLAFIGGFSAATGMIIITTMTLATMLGNHLLLPIIERLPSAQPLRAYLLQIRAALVILILLGSYWFEYQFSNDYILVAIGLFSFVAVLQFVPAALIGLFWPKGNSGGAFAGLLAGFSLWLYTLALPAFVQQGWLDRSILEQGPWGVALLRPQALLGLEGLTPISHSVFWTLLANCLCYWLGSFIYHPHKHERTLTTEFMAAVNPVSSSHKARPTGLDAYIPLSIKLNEAQNLLSRYLSEDKAAEAVHTLADDLQVTGKIHITIIELMEFHRILEHVLAGSIGAASAHSALAQSIKYSEREASELKALYSHIASELKSPGLVQEEDPDEGFNDGFGMLFSLQTQVDTLEETVARQQQELATLEAKLEARQEETFRYRIQAQKIALENQELRERLGFLPESNTPS